MTRIGNCELHHIDCLEFMATLPDKAFDLAIVDPPYGIDCARTINIRNISNGFRGEELHKAKDWDKAIPPSQYFSEIFRTSKNQIIWGGNYFTEHLPPTKAWVFWDKKENKNQGSNFSDGELAWTSFKKVTRYFKFGWIGVDYINNNEDRKIHPTQKPVALYEWLLTNYAKPGQRILDTHLGSGSSAIACNNLGFELVGCELDTDYYAAACKRIHQATARERLFA